MAVASWFISHSKLDPTVAQRIVDRLTGAGVGSLYLSHHPVHGNEAGVVWEEELNRQLRSSVGVVFLASRHAIESKWCFSELRIARMLGRRIIAYRMDSDAAPDLVGDLHWVDAGDEDDPYGPLANAILRATESPADKLPWKPSRSPYPGLGAFSEEYAAVFFGREEKTDQVVDLLSPALPQAGRFVAIVGPSGSGKSSLPRAGVLPRLSGDRWVVLRPMTPGSRPLHSLARSLVKARGRPFVADDVETMVEVLAEGGSDALVGSVDGLTDGRQRVLLVIDQAEELSARTGPRQRKAFLDLLRGGLRPESPLWILATVRSEFLSPAPDRAGLPTRSTTPSSSNR